MLRFSIIYQPDFIVCCKHHLQKNLIICQLYHKIHNKLHSIGYEANTSGMGIGAGQHEVVIGYKMDLNLGRRTRNLHKSVRWL